MSLWFGLALMTAAAIWVVLWPLARRASELRSGSDVAVYRDQLEEIERDRATGLIEDNEAASAQVEVSRRLIAAADAQTALPSSVPSARWPQRAVAIVALVLLPLGAAELYLALGSPLLPDQPLAPRLAAARGNQSVGTLIAQIQGMVERLSERLHRDGADVEGWLRLVRSYTVLGEPDKARAAVVDARRALAGDAIKLRRLDNLLRGLGLEG